MKWEMDKVSVCCPKCGWEPESRIFLTLPLSNYFCNEPERHMKISCGAAMCVGSFKLTDWLRLSFTKK